MGLLDGTTQSAYYQGENLGNYQFTSLNDIINYFMTVYVGEDKIIPKVSRTDVQFHAMRAMQELSFDTFKSCKSQEITVPESILTMKLPQDYVNYVKLTWVDSSGIEHVIYPTSKTSNPTPIYQNGDGDYALTAVGTLVSGSGSITLDAEYKNILVGMSVSGANIPAGAVVHATTNSSSITRIKLADGTGPNAVTLNATYSGDETLTFTPADGSLVIEEESSFILENVSWDANEDKITQSPNTDVSSIKVGMLVSHTAFPVGTKVISVNGAVITTSEVSTTAGSSDEVTFLSDKVISETWSRYKSSTPAENQNDYQDDDYWRLADRRYGIDPQHSHVNGSFFIDCNAGLIHFSSNIGGKTVVLEYISDGLGTDEEMQVHKFAEEAMYKWIMYGILSTRSNMPEYIINRYKKERFAETRKAKLRLSSIKLEEITRILRGKSKQIKH